MIGVVGSVALMSSLAWLQTNRAKSHEVITMCELSKLVSTEMQSITVINGLVLPLVCFREHNFGNGLGKSGLD